MIQRWHSIINDTYGGDGGFSGEPLRTVLYMAVGNVNFSKIQIREWESKINGRKSKNM
jgi:hypothetical protein